MPTPFSHIAHGLRSSAFCLRLLAGLCACTVLATAQGQSTPHPIVSTWSWSLFAGKCAETYQYRADGTLLATSGQAVTEWTYSITPQASERGFYKLSASSVRQNGKPDCSGDVVEEAATPATWFIQFSPGKDRYLACKAESLGACFGPLVRTP